MSQFTSFQTSKKYTPALKLNRLHIQHLLHGIGEWCVQLIIQINKGKNVFLRDGRAQYYGMSRSKTTKMSHFTSFQTSKKYTPALKLNRLHIQHLLHGIGEWCVQFIIQINNGKNVCSRDGRAQYYGMSRSKTTKMSPFTSFQTSRKYTPALKLNRLHVFRQLRH